MAKGSFTRLANNLKRIKENAKRNKRLTFAVTYTAPYAMRVHEDLQAIHPNGGQAKYVETPLRMYRKELTKMVKDKIKKEKKTLYQALKETGEWLLEQSKLLVPVDTGQLRDSGKVLIKRG